MDKFSLWRQAYVRLDLQHFQPQTASMDQIPSESLSMLSGLRRLLSFLRRKHLLDGRLDLEITPDHIKRDIGLLDGREPRRDDGSLL